MAVLATVVSTTGGTPLKVFQLSDSRSALPVVEWGEPLVVRIGEWNPARSRLMRVQTEERAVWEATDDLDDGAIARSGEIAMYAYSTQDSMRISMFWYSDSEILLQHSVVELRVTCDRTLSSGNDCFTMPSDMRQPFASKSAEPPAAADLGSGKIHRDRRQRLLPSLFRGAGNTDGKSDLVALFAIGGMMAALAIGGLAAMVGLTVLVSRRGGGGAMRERAIPDGLELPSQESKLQKMINWQTVFHPGGRRYRTDFEFESSSSYTQPPAAVRLGDRRTAGNVNVST